MWLFGILLALPPLLRLSFAGETAPLRQISDLSVRAEPNPMVRVSTAQILIADYGLLKKDFPFTAAWPNEKIDRWLLDQAGYLSESQVNSTLPVNSEVKTSGQTLEAYRPEGYGRGAVYPAKGPDGKPFGLIDAKGTGAEFPMQRSHGSGLMSSGEGLREFFYEKYISGLLEHQHSSWSTVGTYAVIDWGFDELHPDASKVPAGSILRQAHNRVQGTPGYQYLKAGESRSLETAFRPYGVSAIGDSLTKGGSPSVNLQGTPDKKLVDFGHFIQLESMPSAPTGVYGAMKGTVILAPDDPDWVEKPRLEFRQTVAEWGPYPGQAADPKFDRISGEMHNLAQAFREGRVSRSDIVRAYYEKVEGALSRVRPLPVTPSGEPSAAQVDGAFQAASRILDTTPTSHFSNSAAIDLARNSGLPAPAWQQRLVETVKPTQMGPLLDGLTSVDDADLAQLLIQKGKNVQTWQVTRYLSVIPNGDPRKYDLIRTILDSPQSNQVKMVSVFTALSKDPSPEVLPLLVRVLDDPQITRAFPAGSLEEQLRKMAIWNALTANARRKFKQALQLPPGPLRSRKLGPLLQTDSNPAHGSCRMILYHALDLLQTAGRSSIR